jgi:hypothetical protein
MGEPVFRDWLLAVVPRFPRLSALAAAIATDAERPAGSDEAIHGNRLRAIGSAELMPAVAEALEAFQLTCAPTMLEAGIPWEWHTALLVEQTKASMARHSANRDVPTLKYRFQLSIPKKIRHSRTSTSRCSSAPASKRTRSHPARAHSRGCRRFETHSSMSDILEDHLRKMKMDFGADGK